MSQENCLSMWEDAENAPVVNADALQLLSSKFGHYCTVATCPYCTLLKGGGDIQRQKSVLLK